jgi:hypothetical protein
MKQNWQSFARKTPGIMLQVTSLSDPDKTLSFIPKSVNTLARPSVDFSMTQPENYSF